MLHSERATNRDQSVEDAIPTFREKPAIKVGKKETDLPRDTARAARAVRRKQARGPSVEEVSRIADDFLREHQSRERQSQETSGVHQILESTEGASQAVRDLRDEIFGYVGDMGKSGILESLTDNPRAFLDTEDVIKLKMFGLMQQLEKLGAKAFDVLGMSPETFKSQVRARVEGLKDRVPGLRNALGQVLIERGAVEPIPHRSAKVLTRRQKGILVDISAAQREEPPGFQPAANMGPVDVDREKDLPAFKAATAKEAQAMNAARRDDDLVNEEEDAFTSADDFKEAA